MIARDQRSAYERWELHDFQGGQTGPRPKSTASTNAAAQAETVKLPTAEDIERIHVQAHKDGYTAGYDEGTARARAEAMRLNSLTETLESALAAMDQQVAEELLALALEVARLVVRETLSVKPEVVLGTVREALQQLPQHHAAIFMHPEDIALVRGALGDQLSHASHRLVEDSTLTRGGCRIEAGGSHIDASIETRWRRALASLGVKGDWVPCEQQPR
jgi:flagellar assembly protein FliH